MMANTETKDRSSIQSEEEWLHTITPKTDIYPEEIWGKDAPTLNSGYEGSSNASLMVRSTPPHCRKQS